MISHGVIRVSPMMPFASTKLSLPKRSIIAELTNKIILIKLRIGVNLCLENKLTNVTHAEVAINEKPSYYYNLAVCYNALSGY